jgi:hypothetical protein
MRRFIHDLSKRRWLPLTQIKELAIKRNSPEALLRWKVVAYISEFDSFTCFETDIKSMAEDWIENLSNK